MEDLEAYYKLFGCRPEDSDYVFNEKCNQVFEKNQGDATKYEELQEAYLTLLKSREAPVKPGDVKGEERNLRNIEHELLVCQQKIDDGFKKRDCMEEINHIMLSVASIAPYWMHATKKNLENTGFSQYYNEQYEGDILEFFEEQMKKRIFGSREDKIFGWLKNYTSDKGDFVHYARSSMSHMRSDLKKNLCKISTNELDTTKLESHAYVDFSDEEVKKTKKAEKKRQEIQEKYNIQKLLLILAKGPQVLKISEAVNTNSQSNEFARYYISNSALTFLKEVIREIIPEGITAELVDKMLMQSVPEGNVSTNSVDIYEALAQQFVDFIMTNECIDLDDILTYDLRTYQEVGVDKKGEIRFFKGGIKYIDELLVSYSSEIKGDRNKKSDSLKTIRTRHWKKFEELVFRGQME